MFIVPTFIPCTSVRSDFPELLKILSTEGPQEREKKSPPPLSSTLQSHPLEAASSPVSGDEPGKNRD
jgi:hypothetical protein